MGLFRRRRADPQLRTARDAFLRAASELDAAQKALLAAVPTSRDEGVPLAEAIAAFLAGLDRMDAAMPSWRIAQTEESWKRCFGAMSEARVAAERLRDEPHPPGFEALNARLGEIIAPLEEFAYAALTLREGGSR